MNLADIGLTIDKNQPKEFIAVYLTCMVQGFSLSCPVDGNKSRLNEKWAKVLAKYRRDFSDEFCQGVTDQWFELMSMCDPKSSEFELQLFNAAGLSLENLETDPSIKKKKKTTPEDIPKLESNPRDPLTKPEISSSYRERQMAEAVSLPELDQLKSVHQKAFKSNDADQFLISHLTYAKYGKAKPVPKSTVPQHIREGWESIIGKEFNTIASDDFLGVLTNEWFYLVNQKGIPLTAQDQDDILMTFLAKKKRPETAPKKSSSLFKKLFGR